MDDPIQALRLRYAYRKRIVAGDVRLPRSAAVPLVGPDCAYHLYAWENGTAQPAKKAERKRRPPGR